MEGFEKIRGSWAITNTYGTPVKVTVLQGRKPGQQYRGSCTLLPEDWEEFEAHRDQQIQVFDIAGEHPVLLKKDTVSTLAEPTINLMARIFEMPVEELHALWRGLEEERLGARKAARGPAARLEPTEGTELEPENAELLDGRYAAYAAFRMLDKGGMHARTAVLLQQALTPLRGSFEYVEAVHTRTRRVARITREKTSPAFWLLLLRLEARRNEVLAVRAVADDPQKAITAMAAVEGVLTKCKPERHDYWRWLGPEAYFARYFDELLRPDALELRKRHQLFDKAVLDRGPPPPPGTPMAQRVR